MTFKLLATGRHRPYPLRRSGPMDRWACEATHGLKDIGYLVSMMTNQAGVACGLYSEQHIGELHALMTEELRRCGAHNDCIVYCRYLPEGALSAAVDIALARDLVCMIGNGTVVPMRHFR